LRISKKKADKVVVGEVGDEPHVAVELEALQRFPELRVELGEAVEHPALELRHPRRRHPLRLVEAGEGAEQVAEGVPELSVRVGGGGEHLLADADILEIVGRGGPQAKDVGAALLEHGERVDRVAEALRHLAHVLVEREAVGEHRLVRGAAAGAAALHQRGLEPAAMLVRAFDVEVGADAFAIARLDHVGVGAAAVEPDVEDVGDRLVIVEAVAVAEQGLVVGAEPGVGTALVEGADDPRIDHGVLQILAGLAVDVQRDRNAPGALAADHPVRAAFHHGPDPVLRLLRHPAGRVDGGEGGGS
jgi:hypothetical protein